TGDRRAALIGIPVACVITSWDMCVSFLRLRRSGSALPADELAATSVGKLAAVMYQEAARTGELIRLTRNHPEREFLVGQIGPWELERLGDVIRIDVYRRRGLVHPPRLQFLQAVLGNVVVGLSRAVVIGSHLGSNPSIFTNLVARL